MWRWVEVVTGTDDGQCYYFSTTVEIVTCAEARTRLEADWRAIENRRWAQYLLGIYADGTLSGYLDVLIRDLRISEASGSVTVERKLKRDDGSLRSSIPHLDCLIDSRHVQCELTPYDTTRERLLEIAAGHPDVDEVLLPIMLSLVIEHSYATGRQIPAPEKAQSIYETDLAVIRAHNSVVRALPDYQARPVFDEETYNAELAAYNAELAAYEASKPAAFYVDCRHPGHGGNYDCVLVSAGAVPSPAPHRR